MSTKLRESGKNQCNGGQKKGKKWRAAENPSCLSATAFLNPLAPAIGCSGLPSKCSIFFQQVLLLLFTQMDVGFCYLQPDRSDWQMSAFWHFCHLSSICTFSGWKGHPWRTYTDKRGLRTWRTKKGEALTETPSSSGFLDNLLTVKASISLPVYWETCKI